MYTLSYAVTTQCAAAAAAAAQQLQALFNSSKYTVACVLQANNYFDVSVQRTYKSYNKAVAKFDNTVQQFCNTVEQHIDTDLNPVSCYVLCAEGDAVY